MKLTRTSGEAGNGWTGWGRPVASILAGLALLCSPALWAQETNLPPPTNGTGARFSGDDPARADRPGVVSPTNDVSTTNTPPATNPPPGTNGAVEVSGLAPTNAAATNGNVGLPATTETNAPVEPPRASASGGPSRLDYASFRMIADRNIFNPNRSARSGRFDRREFRRPAQVDSFSLVGTMSYEKGYFAFFDGSSYQYRKALKLDDTIAGYRLTQIGHDSVRLIAGSNTVELKMGTQMRREDEGLWTLSTRSESYASAAPAAGSSPMPPPSGTNAGSSLATSGSEPTPAVSAPSTSASSSESADEVLKKLMQRREQEMNK
jgi:hypothetical protein